MRHVLQKFREIDLQINIIECAFYVKFFFFEINYYYQKNENKLRQNRCYCKLI